MYKVTVVYKWMSVSNGTVLYKEIVENIATLFYKETLVNKWIAACKGTVLYKETVVYKRTTVHLREASADVLPGQTYQQGCGWHEAGHSGHSGRKEDA